METINKLRVRKEKTCSKQYYCRIRSTKAAAHELYAVSNRVVNKSVKTDKVNYICSMAKEAEDAVARGNMKQLYDTTRKLAGKFKTSREGYTRQDNNLVFLTSEEDQIGRRAVKSTKHQVTHQPDIPMAAEVLEVND